MGGWKECVRPTARPNLSHDPSSKEPSMRTLILSAAACMTAVGFPLAEPPPTRAAEMPARIRVLLPPDATLAIDGAPTQSTSNRRDFVTPPLQVEGTYTSDLRARFLRNG